MASTVLGSIMKNNYFPLLSKRDIIVWFSCHLAWCLHWKSVALPPERSVKSLCLPPIDHKISPFYPGNIMCVHGEKRLSSSRFVLLDTVEVEEIVRCLFRAAIITSVFVGVCKRYVVGSSPLEQQLPSLDIDFLKYAVVDPASAIKT